MKVDVMCLSPDAEILGMAEVTLTGRSGLLRTQGNVVVPILLGGFVVKAQAYLPDLDVTTTLLLPPMTIPVRCGDTVTIQPPDNGALIQVHTR